MNQLEDPQKRTGRSGRLILHAIALAKRGRAVYVCAVSKAHAKELEAFRRETAPTTTGIQFDTQDGLDIDWETLTLRGAHKNCVLLVDHAVILQGFGRLLQMYHQYEEADGYLAWDNSRKLVEL